MSHQGHLDFYAARSCALPVPHRVKHLPIYTAGVISNWEIDPTVTEATTPTSVITGKALADYLTKTRPSVLVFKTGLMVNDTNGLGNHADTNCPVGNLDAELSRVYRWAHNSTVPFYGTVVVTGGTTGAGSIFNLQNNVTVAANGARFALGSIATYVYSFIPAIPVQTDVSIRFTQIATTAL